MKFVDNALKKVDNWQYNRRWPGFIAAVVKKYGDEQVGHQAALITYYGFLSLFPLLLVLTTLTSIIADDNPEVQAKVIKGTIDYFPVLGNQLSEHINTLHQHGFALLVGILLTFYGARGVADAFRNAVQNIWQVPKDQREGFPKTILSSAIIIVVGGLGFIAASVAANLAASSGFGMASRLLSLAVNIFLLYWIFKFLINLCLPSHVPAKASRAGAISAAIGLVILQALGGYLLKNELRHLDALYSYFAVALGLLFWIYLQAQVVCYSVTISAVRAQKLWPKKLIN